MIDQELVPVLGVYMVSIIYGYNTNLIKSSYEPKSN